MIYSYECNNINDLEKLNHVYFKITIPRIENAIWCNKVEYLIMNDLHYKVYADDLLLDKWTIDANYRFIYDELNYVSYNNYLIKLWPDDIHNKFSYLFNKNVVPKCKIIFELIINKNLKDLCICDDITKVKTNGDIIVEEIFD